MSGRLAGASALLIGAPALLLVLRYSCFVGNHVLIGASALLLVLRHSFWFFGTPDWCSGTPAGATALLLRELARPDRCSSTHADATALLLHGQAHPVRCYGTPVLYRTFGCLLYCVLLISYNWSR